MNSVRMFAASAAIAMLVASPALAQRQGIGETAPELNTPVHPEGVHPRSHAVPRAHPAPRGGRHARSAYRARAQANPSGDQLNGGRDAAMRECTELSRKYSEPTWGGMQMQMQRSCMAAHGQPE